MISRDCRWLVVVGISCAGVKYLSRAVRSAGLEPVVVADPDRYVGQSREALLECVCLTADITDARSVATALRSRDDLLGSSTLITSPFDEVFPVIDLISADLGLVAPDPVLARLADKAFVASLVPEYSPVTVRLDPAELPDDPPSCFSGQVVLKPSLCTGGLGIMMLRPDALTWEAIADAIAMSGVPGASGQPWLLQQSVDGDLVSLEGYFEHGDLHVIGYSRRTRIGLTEVINTFPADDTLPARARSKAEIAVGLLASRSGFANGYLHCEFLVADDDVYLIDANMGRLSGGVIVEQIALANGLSAEEIIAHSLLLPFDPEFNAPAYKPPSSLPTAIAYHYGLRDGGVVRSVSFPADAQCLHTRYIPDGERVPPVGTSDYAWIGMVAGFPADCDSAVDRIIICTGDGEQPAYCRPEWPPHDR
jgi:ATP-grasp domain